MFPNPYPHLPVVGSFLFFVTYSLYLLFQPTKTCNRLTICSLSLSLLYRKVTQRNTTSTATTQGTEGMEGMVPLRGPRIRCKG
jgi:hypothetical protein